MEGEEEMKGKVSTPGEVDICVLSSLLLSRRKYQVWPGRPELCSLLDQT